MTIKNIGVPNKQIYGDVAEPNAQTTTNTYAVVEDSDLNALPFTSVSYTISVATNNVFGKSWVLTKRIFQMK